MAQSSTSPRRSIITALAVAACGIAGISVAATSPSVSTVHTLAQDDARDGLYWSKTPQRMEKIWTREGMNKLINTPGAMVASTDNSVIGLDSRDGATRWEYRRKDATVCDVSNFAGNVAVLMNPGNGCSDLTLLDAATGQYIAQAQYATDSDVAALTSHESSLAVVTPHHVRLVRTDLVTKTEFGDKPDMATRKDQPVHDCTISDVIVGPNHMSIAAQCNGEDFYHVYVADQDVEESSKSNVVLDVDTHSTQPVTLPAMSIAMVSFVTQGTNPTQYVWEIDKDKEEVSATKLSPQEYGLGYMDVPGIGYVWKIGQNVHLRHGSEDISQSTVFTGAIGMPIEVNGQLLVPTHDGATLWDTSDNKKTPIAIDGGFNGRYFAFSGSTYAALGSDGVIIGYGPAQ